MPVNETLATYSDYSFFTTVALYVIAMILHLGEYSRRWLDVAGATRRKVSVPAGAVHPHPAGSADPHTDLPLDDLTAEGGSAPAASGPRSGAQRCGRSAVSLTVLGVVLHVASIVLRGLAVDRVPWGNMYEFSSAICLVAIVVWLVALHKNPSIRPIGTFVLLPVVVLLFLVGTVLYVQAGPVMPALQSYWLAIHVTTASISGGLLLVAGVASALFLARRSSASRDEEPTRSAELLAVLPDAATLDRVAYRVTVVALPIWTFAVMTGAIWAESAWGKFWSWDPKETVALVAWIVYAAYLHARATAGWRNGGAAWVNVAGFAVMMFNLFFINLVVAGMHSYAGV